MLPGLAELTAAGASSRSSSLAFEQLLLSADQGNGGEAADGRRTYLVALRQPAGPDLVAAEATRLLEPVAPGSRPRQVYAQLGAFAVDLEERQAQELGRRPEVASVEADRPLELEPPVGEPVLLDDELVVLPQVLVAYLNGRASSGETLPYGTRALWRGRDLSSLGNVGIGTYAFVIDSGVLTSTGDLNLNTAWSRSWIAGQDPFTDGAGHGTHVAGTIGALVNGFGIVGVAPGASIVSLKVFDSTGTGSMSSVIAAIDYAVSVITTNNLDLAKVVVNLSLGGSYSPALDAAIRRAADLGIRFAVAAGNSGVDVDTTSPASAGTHPNVYTVSAVDSGYVMPSWSNWDQVTAADPSDSIDLAAPGVNVMSYYKNGLLAYLSGTSMAAPHVAGALLMGGVQPGDPVTPTVAGTADPFAWLAAAGSPTAPAGVSVTLSAPAAIDEGQSLQLAIASSGIAAGTTLYWSLSGAGIALADFSTLSALSGTSLVLADGSASINLSISADLVSEGNELLGIQLYTDAARTQLVASRSVTLNDTSRAPIVPQVLWGSGASDSIIGGEGNDQIAGVLASGSTALAQGQGQVDVLTGGLGADTFLLADARGVFYDDGLASNLGANDYARISDFRSGEDKLQLRNGNYFTTITNGSTSIYWDANGNGRFETLLGSSDELIAVLQNSTLASSDILWI